MSTTRPSKPSVRSVSAALAPARLAPTMTNVWVEAMAPPWLVCVVDEGHGSMMHLRSMHHEDNSWHAVLLRPLRGSCQAWDPGRDTPGRSPVHGGRDRRSGRHFLAATREKLKPAHE